MVYFSVNLYYPLGCSG